jgi:HAD superfamily hydrolase (TIGR01458 family)
MTLRVRGCLIDLDGTLFHGDRAIDGAAAAVARLRSLPIGLAFGTNTTRMPRSVLIEGLAGMGIDLAADELVTAPVAAARWLERHGCRRVSLLLPEATHEDFAAFHLDDEAPDAVVVGDLGEGWTFDRLNRAARALGRGARLLAVQKNRLWDPGDGPRLDAGPFVVALEYASGQEAVLVGKPSAEFVRSAASSLEVAVEHLAVVGDNVDTEVRGAQAAGAVAVAVRTGSFSEAALEGLERPPEAVLGSIADLPAWLGA